MSHTLCCIRTFALTVCFVLRMYDINFSVAETDFCGSKGMKFLLGIVSAIFCSRRRTNTKKDVILSLSSLSSGRRGYSPQRDISSEFEYEISDLRMRFFFGKYFQYFISRVMFSLGTTMILAERGLSEVNSDPYSRLSIENSSNYLHLLLD